MIMWTNTKESCIEAVHSLRNTHLGQVQWNCSSRLGRLRQEDSKYSLMYTASLQKKTGYIICKTHASAGDKAMNETYGMYD